MKLIKFPFLALVLIVFFSCDLMLKEETEEAEAALPAPSTDNSTYVPPSNSNIVKIAEQSAAVPYNNSAQKVIFSEGKSTVDLTGLQNHSVYLVKTNKGNTVVLGKDAGKVLNMGVPKGVLAKNARNAVSVTKEQLPFAEDAPVSGIFIGPNGETIIRYDYRPDNEKILGDMDARSVSRDVGAESGFSGYTVDSSAKKFWTQDDSGTKFKQIDTTLRAAGTYSNVWVAETNYASSDLDTDNTITSARAKALAENFDIIYEKETAVFGFEYGGGLRNPDGTYSGNGGVDGDPKIQILVYDVFDDYKPGLDHGVFGYFSTVDTYKDGDPALGGRRSNAAEIFYIDAHFTNYMPETMYSTLAHEFQHMINYNQKNRIAKKYTATWYNEMLSMLAEDLIDPFIGIDAGNNGHPIQTRIPVFLANYTRDPTIWLSSNVYTSYANAYALGAYLVRNIGGVDFVKSLMSNYEVDAASLDAALKSTANPLKNEVNNFETALSRYGEAILFNQLPENRPENVLSFNNTVSETLPSGEYTFIGFDLFSLSGYKINNVEVKGPIIWNVDESYSMDKHSVLLLSNNGWQNVTGNLSITLQQPANPNIEFYIIVR
jgi:hypothetical protein